ncbi:MAG: amidohydrolase family protein, partial [Ruthenibacterium sp.]
MGSKAQSDVFVTKADTLIDLGSRVITPGFCDVHTFFAGWVLRSLGIDFSSIRTGAQGVEALLNDAKTKPDKTPLFGHCWQQENFSAEDTALLDKTFPDTPVVVFTFDRDNCWMNAAARRKYLFTPEACWAEMIWRMMADYLTSEEVQAKYTDYMQLLNSRGITSIKEMTFDNYYGFADTMEHMEKESKMTVRVSMMSQPVGSGINISHGKAMQRRFVGPFIRFSGYNRMTDRGIPRFLGELIEPYKSRPDITCMVPVEWALIEKEVHEADKNGFRYSLHCQGDGAVRHAVALYDSCEKTDGKLKNRHAITDLEYSNPVDLQKFGAMGGITEVYAQIQSLDQKQDVMNMIDEQLGTERGKNYWNRRKMWDSGLCVSCGTDLPLLIPDIPEAIYCGCGGYFADGERFNKQNML